MVALKHVEKYIGDNPEFFPHRERILVSARALAALSRDCTILSGAVEDLLGTDHAAQLFELMATHPEYLRISGENIDAAIRSQN